MRWERALLDLNLFREFFIYIDRMCIILHKKEQWNGSPGVK